jgi:hypothetical protein
MNKSSDFVAVTKPQTTATTHHFFGLAPRNGNHQGDAWYLWIARIAMATGFFFLVWAVWHLIRLNA